MSLLELCLGTGGQDRGWGQQTESMLCISEKIHAAQEEGRKKLADIQKDQAELVELVGEIKRQTGERTRQLEQAIRGLAR